MSDKEFAYETEVPKKQKTKPIIPQQEDNKEIFSIPHGIQSSTNLKETIPDGQLPPQLNNAVRLNENMPEGLEAMAQKANRDRQIADNQLSVKRPLK